MDEDLLDYLRRNGIAFKVHSHSPVHTVAESNADEDIKKIPGLRSKNLFVKDEKGKFYLITLPAQKRLDMKRLKSALKVKEIHFASKEELKDRLNLTPGSVSIFGMIYAKDVVLIIDKELFDADIVGFHPNINTATLEIKHPDLVKFISTLNCHNIIISL